MFSDNMLDLYKKDAEEAQSNDNEHITKGYLGADILALIDEIRRMRQAYQTALYEIETSAAINSLPFYEMLRDAFEPELSAEQHKDENV